MKDIDIQGMDKKELKEYLYSLILARKKTEAEKLKLEKELNKWDSRVKLAQEKGKEDLKQEAHFRLEETRKRFTNIDIELKEINGEIEKIKRRLKGSIGKINYSVDSELLLEQLKMLTEGTKNRELREIEADFMLKELKEKLKETEDTERDD